MTSLPSLEVYHDRPSRSAALNMALDEVIWVTGTTPRIRFYEWDHRAISFGYFGQYAEVAHYHHAGWELVRRCTGGGVVFHGKDLTYALIIPAGSFSGAASPNSIYQFVHEAIKRALSQTGVAATLKVTASFAAASGLGSTRVTSDDPKRPSGAPVLKVPPQDSCFANPVRADVMLNGVKIAGAAQRRSRRGLLQQGSIQNVQLPTDFTERFTRILCPKACKGEIDDRLTVKADELAGRKYATAEWLRRR